MYTQDAMDKKEKRKIIAVAVGAVALILILIVAIVVVATKKSSKAEVDMASENSSFEMVGQEEDSGAKAEPSNEAAEQSTGTNSEKTTVGSLSTEKNTISQSENKTNTMTVTSNSNSNSMPNTGPEEILPGALVAGMLVAYLSSVVLAKTARREV